MYCPNCGSPVMRHGTSWECGYCGDFGSCYSSEDSPRTVELSFLFFVDFSDVWNSLKASLAALCPRRATVMRPLLAKAMLYQVSAAIRRRGEPPDPRKALELRAFLKKNAGSPHLSSHQPGRRLQGPGSPVRTAGKALQDVLRHVLAAAPLLFDARAILRPCAGGAG